MFAKVECFLFVTPDGHVSTGEPLNVVHIRTGTGAVRAVLLMRLMRWLLFKHYI